MRGDVTLADLAPVIEATAELGSDLIVANCHDPDYCRYLANLAAYCEAAAPYGIRLVVECMPYTEVRSIDQALAIIAAVDQPNLGFLPDPLHLRTCGIAPSEIAKVDPARIFFAQICDAPLAIPADIAGVIDEARAGFTSYGGHVALAPPALEVVRPDTLAPPEHADQLDAGSRSVAQQFLARRARFG